MGLFDLFGSRESREQGQLRKLAQKVTQKYGPPENRQKVIEQLGELGSPGALGVLCLRFTIRIDVGIQDDEEKERVRQILVAAGSGAVEPVKAFLRQQESGVAWGLRVLSALVPAEELRAAVLELLTKLGREYTRDPEKKLTLLTWLQEHPDLLSAAPGAGQPPEAALLPLLEDFSDDVRISTVRALARVPLAEATREGLIALLLRDRDNARVRGEVLEALAAHGADVKGH
ncbi:MAG TPA: HEAT repeat domain-containing protein, partial [Anaeromyxobacteraceae bacterium]|nr:HEAT repeat domain-containing protein [Anaeromyxobacteraceae bacterium]